jgi:hypothetical protein
VRIKMEIKTDLSSSQKKRYTLNLFYRCWWRFLTTVRKADVPEGKGWWFPVSGQWLKCTNPEVIAKHEAKVYGKASVGAPIYVGSTYRFSHDRWSESLLFLVRSQDFLLISKKMVPTDLPPSIVPYVSDD